MCIILCDYYCDPFVMGLSPLCWDSFRPHEGGFSGCDLFNGLEVCNEKFHIFLLERLLSINRSTIRYFMEACRSLICFDLLNLGKEHFNQSVHHLLCLLIIIVCMLALFSNAILYLDLWVMCSIVPFPNFEILFGSWLMLGWWVSHSFL